MIGLFVLIALAAISFLAYRFLTQEFKSINDRGHQTFEGMQLSTQEFYQLVEEKIKEKGITGVKFSRVNYTTRGLFSIKREYLRIKYCEYVFEICAAPFAKDFFVSFWQSEVSTPIDAWFAGRRDKTFYEMDTELMFRSTVRLCIDRAIEEIGEAKGARQLNPDNWRSNGKPVLTT